jgi:hypothetical protein
MTSEGLEAIYTTLGVVGAAGITMLVARAFADIIRRAF